MNKRICVIVWPYGHSSPSETSWDNAQVTICPKCSRRVCRLNGIQDTYHSWLYYSCTDCSRDGSITCWIPIRSSCWDNAYITDIEFARRNWNEKYAEYITLQKL